MSTQTATTNGQGIEFHDRQISMAHGAGGEATRRLVEGLFQPAFSNPWLNALADAATFAAPSGRLAMTADSFVVQPLEFPGGSIGELAVNGTVNDLAVSGAWPLALTVTFILEAGLDTRVLKREVEVMARAARRAGVPIVGGDTKVVEHGKGDGIYISTTGIGTVDPRVDLRPQRVQPGDRVIVSGPIGNHGMAIMLARAELEIDADIRSDTRPLTALVAALIDAAGQGVKWMRDATRGGVATVLNELAQAAGAVVAIEEEAVPVDDAVRGACELLGLDPLQVANEGQFVAIVDAAHAERALAALHATPGGEKACFLGQIESGPQPHVLARASYGGARVVDVLIGDPLPRIC
jgi:hydrogenase expression/formation protein HypE